MDPERPLDQDIGLPFPEAGQGSAVFSLTALFTPYLALCILFGLPALIGLALGTATGLLGIRAVLSKNNGQETFQEFVGNKFLQHRESGMWLLIFISVTQLGFALSELLILREIAFTWLQMSQSYANLFAISLAVVGYLYCVDGGYQAVFRTDVVQFLLILLMCLALVTHQVVSEDAVFLVESVQGRFTDFWHQGYLRSPWSEFFNLTVSFSMGLAFVVSGPDTWKRVSLVLRTNRRGPVLRLLLAAGIPLGLLFLILTTVDVGALEQIARLEFLADALGSTHQFFVVIVLLGLISAFLSSFDSALIASTHTLLMSGFLNKKAEISERDSFYRNIGLLFLLLITLFYILLEHLQNPYLVANILLGSYAILAGILVGTAGLRRHLNVFYLLTLLILGTTIWWTYVFVALPDISKMPSIRQIETIPLGMILALAAMLYSFLLSKKDVTTNA